MPPTSTIRLRSGYNLTPYTAQPRYTIQSISDISVARDNENCCPICMESFDNQIGDTDESGQYVIPECNHRFHTACLMEWFRREQRCPMCRDDAGINLKQRSPYLHYRETKGKVQLVKKLCKEAKAPRYLQQLLKRYMTFQEKLKVACKELREAIRIKDLVNYKQHNSLIRRLRNKQWEYNKKIRELEGQMSCYRITEIIIRKKQK